MVIAMMQHQRCDGLFRQLQQTVEAAATAFWPSTTCDDGNHQRRRFVTSPDLEHSGNGIGLLAYIKASNTTY